MRNRWLSAAFVLLFAVAAFAQSALPYQKDFPPEEFKARWQKVFDKIGPNAVALVQGVGQTSGFTYPRQTNDFYYLCGIETPQSYLLLDGRTHKATLFLPPRNPRMEAAEGRVISAEDADQVKQLVGVDDVKSVDAMRGDCLGAGRDIPREIYTPFAPAEAAAQSRYEIMSANAGAASDYWDGRISRESQLIELLRARYSRASLKDLTPVIDELRSVKSPREIVMIRRASQLAGHGMIEAIRSSRPGVYEYQLEAAANYIFRVNGARIEGYRSITASGTANIWNMHYWRNEKQLAAGDMVLMDYAPDYHYYVSDIGRMWPVSGKYLPWQRELLQFVLDYRNAIMQRIRPGVTPKQIMDEAKTAMEPVFARTKFSKPIYEQAARRLVETGGGVFSHPVGLTVHDDGDYSKGVLQPGHVFAVDPQLRVPEESLYIRYEDTVVVTPTGVENFTDFLPTELNDLERLVQGGNGVVQKVAPLPQQGQ